MTDKQAPMLNYALAYAEKFGLYVFPCHTPLSDDKRGYLCTCEEWRHSAKCKSKRPDLYLEAGQHCDRPGKHPRGAEHGAHDATRDPAQIRQWWTKYPTANIACVPGLSGHVVLDADLYKDTYQGDGMLTPEEERTPTVITGGGGTHLWYRKPDGATYSNAPGEEMPAGVDVRADNGYVLLPPSLHASGNRYQWEEGFKLSELAPQLLPERIHDMLTAATRRGGGQAVTFADVATERPDLRQWPLSGRIADMIYRAHAPGERSEADAAVTMALCRAGASDDEIRAVFQHYPIGTAGKYAEAGDRYLAVTISTARAKLAKWHGGYWWTRFLPDEAGITAAFLDRYGADWAYVTGFELWHGWQGTHWQADRTRRLRLAIGCMLDDIHDEAAEHARDLQRDAEAMPDGAKDSPERQAKQSARADAKAALKAAEGWRKSAHRVYSVDELLKDARAVHAQSIIDGNLLNLRNGTLDLDTFTLRPHDRADLLTTCLPYDFDPTATCPRWVQFLAEVLVKEDGRTPDLDLAALMQEAVGLALTVETIYETFFWLSGTGSNGKSVMLKTIAALLGDLAQSFDLDTLSRPDASYYLARLTGARFVWTTESNQGSTAADGILKRLASGETITARPIRGAPVEVHPVCKLFWAMNNKPAVRDTSDGFWRRLRLIPFYRKFEEHEKDLRLSDQLRAELPGILNWAIEGLQRLRRQGRFTAATAVAEAVSEYRTSQNAVELWLKDATTWGIEPHARPNGAETKSATAYQSYTAWCMASGRKPQNLTNFGRELVLLGVAKSTSRNGVHYSFGLLSDDEMPAHWSESKAPVMAHVNGNGNHTHATNGGVEAILLEHGL